MTETMELIKVDQIYELINSSYDQRIIPKAAGFRWNARKKRWWTDDLVKAQRLSEFAKGPAKAALTRADNVHRAAVAASAATSSEVDLPCPVGQEYLPYQRGGIAYALDRKSTLIGDEMGLGKTIQALGVVNATPKAKRVLIICPASLRLNWEREAKKWLVNKDLSIGIAQGKDWPATDVVIINYDILTKHKGRVHGRTWDVLIVDEAHYLKNPKAQRTKQVFGDYAYKTKTWNVSPLKAKRRLLLTGTPIVNRPIELWGLINYLAPDEFDNFFRYAKRYADAHYNGWAWDFSGAQNLEELQEKLRSLVMVRRLKADVLPDLPPKRRQVIELPANGAKGKVRAEQAAWADQEERLTGLKIAIELAKISQDPSDYDKAVAALSEGALIAFAEMSKLRHETALAKVPYVIDHVADAAEGGKVIVFAHHIDVVAQIVEGLEDRGVKTVSLTGKDPMDARQAAVDSFQGDDEVKVFVGNIKAAGVGITLTAASHVVFAELDWVPANLSQAEDRAHRIGQTNNVLIQHLVLEGSLDQQIASQIVTKQAVIDQALDNEIDLDAEDRKVPLIPTADNSVSDIVKSEVDKWEDRKQQRDDISPDQQDAIHGCLKILAGLCDGASSRDDMGFNGVDTNFGHSLARQPILTPKQSFFGRKIIAKYHRQLPSELLTTALNNGGSK